MHRDLKPSNILLPARRVVLIDFGIAHVLDATTRLTSAGTLLGTPCYMAPEQIEGTAGPPPSWALGATLYEATEGHPPFNGPALTTILAAILTRDPPPPRHAGPLASLLMTLLSKDPAARPALQALADALTQATRQAEATAKVKALTDKAKELHSQGLHADAEAAYREVIRLDPGHALAHNGLGNVLEDTGRLAEAEAAYREAIRLDPGNALAWDNLKKLLQAPDKA